MTESTTNPVPYPVNLSLAGQRVLVVGGGEVAARKAETLLQSGASVTVVAPAAVAGIADHPLLTWHQRRYQPSDAGEYRLVITATDDPEVNAAVARDCDAANVFVNSADDPANCTFTLPSIARRGDLQIAVSTSGRSPAMARWMRLQIERKLDEGYVVLLELLAEAREESKAVHGTSEIPGWEAAIDAGLIGLIRAGLIDEARRRLLFRLGLPAPDDAAPEQSDALGQPVADDAPAEALAS